MQKTFGLMTRSSLYDTFRQDKVLNDSIPQSYLSSRQQSGDRSFDPSKLKVHCIGSIKRSRICWCSSMYATDRPCNFRIISRRRAAVLALSGSACNGTGIVALQAGEGRQGAKKSV